MIRNRAIEILNVNDHPPTRYLLNRIVSSAGYQVRDVETGKAALESVEEDCPHLVLLDVRLPDIDGFTVCQRLKSLHSTLPILMASAWFTSDGDYKTGLTSGADGYLYYPTDREKIVAKIDSVLRLYAHLQQIVTSRTELQQQNEHLLARLGSAKSANVGLQKEIERLQSELQRLKDQQSHYA